MPTAKGASIKTYYTQKRVGGDMTSETHQGDLLNPYNTGNEVRFIYTDHGGRCTD